MATSAPSPALQVFLKEHLLYVHTKAEAGEYADAMAALQETKASIKDNIYVRAVEQQLLTLLDLSRRNALTDERRTEILDPITGIIDRAIGSMPYVRQQASPLAQQLSQNTAPATLGADEKQAALDRLKVQYFEQAGRHLSAGEYSLALAEIHRVFVIDPENATAKQYESIIQELMNLKGRPPSNAAPAQASHNLSDEGIATVEEPPETSEVIEPENPVESEADHELQDDESFNDEVSESVTEAAAPPESDPEEPPIIEPPVPEMPQTHVPLPPRLVEPRHVYSHTRQAQVEDHSPQTRRKLIAVGGVVVVLAAAVASFFLFFSGPSAQPPETRAATTSTPGSNNPADRSQASSTPQSSATEQAASPATSGQRTASPGRESKEPTASKSDASPSAPSSSVKADPPATRSRAAVQETKIQPVVTEDESKPTATEPSTTASTSAATPPSTQPLTVAEAEPEPFIAVEKDPQLVKLQTPDIPDIAWGASSDVQVILRVLVDADGKPVKAKVLKGDNPAIQNAAVNAVMKSTFTPGIMGKSSVTAWVTLPLKFHRHS